MRRIGGMAESFESEQVAGKKWRKKCAIVVHKKNLCYLCAPFAQRVQEVE